MPIPLACPCGHHFAVEDESIGKVVSCPDCGLHLSVLVEARPESNPNESLLGVWRYKDQLIGLTDRVIWLARSKDEKHATELQTEICNGSYFLSALRDQAETTLINLQDVTAVRMIQEWEEALFLHVDHRASVGKTETIDVVFEDGDDRNHAVDKLQHLPGWQSRTSQVGLREAIAPSLFFIGVLSGALLFYWILAYFVEGKDLSGNDFSWFFLHLPINILGVTWLSIILGSFLMLFLIQLVRRVIWHPFQVTLLPPGNGKARNGNQAGQQSVSSTTRSTPNLLKTYKASIYYKGKVSFPVIANSKEEAEEKAKEKFLVVASGELGKGLEEFEVVVDISRRSDSSLS